MLRRLSILVLAVLAAAALAVEGEAPKPATKPKEKEAPSLPAPTDGDVDRPGKPGVAPPTAIPEPEKAEGDAREAGKGAPPEKVNPFRQRSKLPSYAKPARIMYSDGKALEGHVWRRADATIRIFNRDKRAHEDYYVSDLKRIDVTPETENFERDWRWKNQGSSEKVFLDTGYLWNQYITTFSLTDGSKAAGDCSGQFYIQTLDGTKDKWYLYKRQSGGDDRTKPHKKREETEPLVYVKSVEFTDDFLKKAEDKQ